jgi:hypothetical protein
MPIVAWYVLSKESYMKRVIRDVLPTGGHIRVRIFCSVLLSVLRIPDHAYRSAPPETPAYKHK